MEIMDQAANLRKLAGERSESAPPIGGAGATTLERTELEDIVEPETRRGRVVAVTSGKGGVGKSTLSVNMAIALGRLGKKVLLFDGDLGLANINVLMGIIPEFSIYEVLKGKKKLSDIIIPTGFGIDIIAGANGISQLANLTDAQRDLFVEQLSELDGYDILMIDTGAGVGSNVLGLVLPADDIIVVTTPEPTAITDAYGMIKSIVAASGSEKKIKLIVNRAPSAIEAKRVADRLMSISGQFLKIGVESLGFVFEENLVQKSIRSQRPHVVLYPGSKSAACINHIGARLVNASVKEDSQGIFAFFQQFLGLGQSRSNGDL
jgi:flagellar biosynthesis protein FlhG